MQDYTTRGNPTYLHQAELHQPFPDWVANQPLPSADDFTKTASAAFADPARRLLPISTPVAVFHSAIDLFANMAEYDSSAFDRVKSAAAVFGIERDIAPYAELFAERLEKSASEADTDTSCYAIDETISGERYRLLPLNDAHEVRDSAAELSKMAVENRIHYLMLIPAARRIAKAASDKGVDGLPYVIKRAGIERMADLDVAARLLLGRASFAKSASAEQVSGQYEEALKQAIAGECSDMECVEKIAAIDHAAGISYRFTEQHPVIMPHEIIFNGPVLAEVEKIAALNVCVNDVLVPLTAVMSIDPVEASFKLSKSAAAALSQHRESTDAREISLAVMNWDDNDRRTLLRLAVAAA